MNRAVFVLIDALGLALFLTGVLTSVVPVLAGSPTPPAPHAVSVSVNETLCVMGYLPDGTWFDCK